NSCRASAWTGMRTKSPTPPASWFRSSRATRATGDGRSDEPARRDRGSAARRMTTAASAADRAPRWRREWTLVAIVFLFLLGLRLTVLRIYGAALPYSDQWDSEGWDLLRPYLLGQGVDWHMLFAPHNEHRIVFARLEALVLFALNDGQWDNLLGATADAILVAALPALAVRALLRQPVRDRFAFAALL